MNRFISRKIRRAKLRWPYAPVYALFSMVALICLVGIFPAIFPSTGSWIADQLRSVFGPQPVAALETISFRIQDGFNQIQYSISGGKPQISVGGQGRILDRVMLATPTAENEPASSVPSPSPTATINARINIILTSTLAQPVDVVNADPYIGWQPYGSTSNGQTMMAQTVVKLDPGRPYAGIAMVRIDLSLLQLHMVPGLLEPASSIINRNTIPNLGLIAKEDLGHLVAGFNGGFKAVNGHYGMMANYVTLLPAFPGVATIAIYKDGHIQLGTWGRDMFPDPNIVSLRQNCPPILQNGMANPLDYFNDPSVWGHTVGNGEITWRSGLGMSKDGRFLIYAASNGTTIPILAQALQYAGAYNAMQLDINQPFIQFVTYVPNRSNTSVNAVRLLDQMKANPKIFLNASARDFFYLTIH